MPGPRIGIFGHYGNENLGDEAIIQACIQRILDLEPSAELTLLSVQPDDSRDRYGLPAHPIRRIAGRRRTPTEQVADERAGSVDHTGTGVAAPEPALKRLLKSVPLLPEGFRGLTRLVRLAVTVCQEARFLWDARRVLRGLDLLLVAGSNQFLDNFGGPWGFPYTLFKWSRLAKLVGTKVAYVSVGAGPLSEKLSHRFVRAAVGDASYLSFRDEASRALVDPEGRYHGRVHPDLAFSVDAPKRQSADPKDRAGLVVAVNPMAVYDARYWYVKDAEKYTRYVAGVAGFVRRLESSGHTPLLFATQPHDENVIEDVCKLLEQEHGRVDARSMFRALQSVDDLLAFLGTVDVVVPTRFHGTVLALWAGKPTIGICYYRKSADLLEAFGQQRFAFELEAVTADSLIAAFREIEAEYDSIASEIRGVRDAYRSELDEQLREVLALCRRNVG